MPSNLKSQVQHRIAEALQPHPWLYDVIINGETPDTNAVGVDGAIKGVFAVLGAVVDSLDLIATHIDEGDEILL